MDIAHLRDFITVVDCGSLTRAATELYVSQPAISQRISHLENELGIRLPDRGPRGVIPTRAGHALYRDAPPDADEVDLADLQNTPLVLPGGRSNLRSLVDRAFAAQGMVPTIVADIDSLGALIRIAHSGEACTILPLSSVADHEPGLGAHRIRNPTIQRRVAVCNAVEHFPTRDAVAAVEQGIAAVTRHMASSSQWPGIRVW